MPNTVYEFACDELRDLDRKAKAGDLTMSDIEYADKLEHLKKSVLTNRAMEGEGYSGNGYGTSYGDMGPSYARQPRDGRGRYVASYADHSLAQGLRSRAAYEPDQRSRMDMERMADRIERGA